MRGCVSCREMERREKVEEARRETERILAEQEAEVAKRKVSTVREGAQRCAQQQGYHQHMPSSGGGSVWTSTLAVGLITIAGSCMGLRLCLMLTNLKPVT